MEISPRRHRNTTVKQAGKETNTALKVAKGARRIRQRYKSDCGVACVAMVARVNYSTSFGAFSFSKDRKTFYTSHNKLEDALKVLGFQVHLKKFRSWDDISGSAIIPVNHRCHGRNFHWVVYDRKAILDPNPNRPARQKALSRYRSSGWYLQVNIKGSDDAKIKN